jgi:hypothetical protein
MLRTFRRRSPRSGQGDGERLGDAATRFGPWPGFFLGVLAAVPLLAYLRGFTVDDALIPARYAAHIANGLGYRFNAHGPSTDGVTPLGWAYLLAPFAGGGPLSALRAARVIGAAAWLLAAGGLGIAIASLPGSKARFAALLLVLCSAPLGAWAAAGLETGVVVALATAAAVLPSSHSLRGSAAVGACACFRPEMLAYACILAVGRARGTGSIQQRAWVWALSIGPWCAAATIRTIAWGRPAPLAVMAKPSDVAHGLAYVVPALLFSGAPLAACAPLAIRKLRPWGRVLLAGAAVHLAVVVLAGGDWMPLARLVCPVLPSLVVVAAELLALAPRSVVVWTRLALACAAEISVLVLRGPAAARVMGDRMTLIEAARPVLAHAERVATIDVGWVGAATDAEIVDLAGATDPEIAALAGGHTSKAVSGAFLTDRRPDRLIFQLKPGNVEPGAPRYVRTIELRLASDPLIRPAYHSTWVSPRELSVAYEILSRD